MLRLTTLHEDGWRVRSDVSPQPKCRLVGAAHLPFVGAHQAADTGGAGAVLAVGVRLAEPSPRPAAVAAAGGVLVGAAEDVPGLVREDAIDVVGPPAVVAVVHDDAGPADRGVGEVVDRIALDEEDAVRPVGVPVRAQPVHVVADAVPVGLEAQRGHRRVAEAALVVGRRSGRLRRDVHDAHVVVEAHARPRVERGQPAGPGLHLGHDLRLLGGGELGGGRRAVDDHHAERDRTDEVAARGGRRLRVARPRLRLDRRHVAAGHVPDLALTRPVGLRLEELRAGP